MSADLDRLLAVKENAAPRKAGLDVARAAERLTAGGGERDVAAAAREWEGRLARASESADPVELWQGCVLLAQQLRRVRRWRRRRARSGERARGASAGVS